MTICFIDTETTGLRHDEPLGEADRHTALGDARWVRDVWDKVMGEDGTGG
jgi:DNA polymerase III epsilon subunit-like protein